MNVGELLIGLALIIPLFTAALVYAVGRMPDVRETLTMVGAVFLAIVTISMTIWTAQGSPPSLVKVASTAPPPTLKLKSRSAGSLEFGSSAAFVRKLLISRPLVREMPIA